VQLGLFEEALAALQDQPGADAPLATLQRAARAVEGSARLIDLAPAAGLARRLDACLSAAQRGELTLAGELGVLRESARMLARLGEAATSAEQLSALEGELADLSAKLPALNAPPAPPSPGQAASAPCPAENAREDEPGQP